MKFLKSALLLPICILSTSVYAAPDAQRGKVLHDQSCAGCHDTKVYSRPQKRMQSLAALQGQVKRCTQPAGAEWDQQDLADVVEYLNSSFYQFK